MAAKLDSSVQEETQQPATDRDRTIRLDAIVLPEVPMVTVARRSIFLALLSGAGVLPLVGCAPTAPRPPVAYVTVTPSPAQILVHSTVQLNATPRDVDGNPLTDRVVTWASSAPSVAWVSESGLVTGVSVCKATIAATSEGVQGLASISVSAPVGSASMTGGGRSTCS